MPKTSTASDDAGSGSCRKSCRAELGGREGDAPPARIWHARVDVGIVEGDFVGEVVVRELPQYGPWPAEAHHLLHHHDNRAVLYWLTITGTGPVEILAEAFDVDWPSVPSGAVLAQ